MRDDLCSKLTAKTSTFSQQIMHSNATFPHKFQPPSCTNSSSRRWNQIKAPLSPKTSKISCFIRAPKQPHLLSGHLADILLGHVIILPKIELGMLLRWGGQKLGLNFSAITNLKKMLNMNAMQTCNSVTFYFMKNSFSDVGRKWILPNMIRAGTDCTDCNGQFTPKMKANAKPRLLSSLV